jgi:hypothetical protein
MSSALNYRYPAIQGDDGLPREFEDELEEEYEEELESELGRAEAEEEYELEDELEDEFEGEQFGGLDRALGGFVARGAEGEEEIEGEVEGELEEEAEVEFDFEAEAEAEAETEDEWELEEEYEDEGEAFVNPIRRIYRDAELMAHLSARAAESESEDEAEAFVGAMVPIAARLIPRAGRLLTRNAPALIRGVSRLTRQLRRNPATRRFIRALPVILQRTAQSLADQAARGRPITADTVIRTLTRVAARVLGRPANRRRAVRAAGVFDRRYQNRWRTGPPGRRGTTRPRPRRVPSMAVRRDGYRR